MICKFLCSESWRNATFVCWSILLPSLAVSRSCPGHHSHIQQLQEWSLLGVQKEGCVDLPYVLGQNRASLRYTLACSLGIWPNDGSASDSPSMQSTLSVSVPAFLYNLFFLKVKHSSNVTSIACGSLGVSNQRCSFQYDAFQGNRFHAASGHQWSISWKYSWPEAHRSFLKPIRGADLALSCTKPSWDRYLEELDNSNQDHKESGDEDQMRIITYLPDQTSPCLTEVIFTPSTDMWSYHPRVHQALSTLRSEVLRAAPSKWYKGILKALPGSRASHSNQPDELTLACKAATINIVCKGRRKQIAYVTEAIVNLGELAQQLQCYPQVQEVTVQAKVVNVPSKLVFPCSLIVDQLESKAGLLRIGYLQVHGNLMWTFPGLVELYSRLYIGGDCVFNFDGLSLRETSQTSVEGRFSYLSGLNEQIGHGWWLHEGLLFAKQVFVYAIEQTGNRQGNIWTFQGGLCVAPKVRAPDLIQFSEINGQSLPFEPDRIRRPVCSTHSPPIPYRTFVAKSSLEKCFENEAFKQRRMLFICERMASMDACGWAALEDVDPHPIAWLNKLQARRRALSKMWKIITATNIFGLFPDNEAAFTGFPKRLNGRAYQVVHSSISLNQHMLTLSRLSASESITQTQFGLEQSVLELAEKIDYDFNCFVESICAFNPVPGILYPYLQRLNQHRMDLELLKIWIEPFLEDLKACDGMHIDD